MKKLLIIIPTILFVGTANGQSFCYEQGECIGGNIVDFQPGDSNYNNCLDVCLANTKCNYFTYSHDALACITFDSCPTFETNACIDCHSGERNCSHYRQCGERGACVDGGFVGIDATENENGCIASCHNTNGCLYYTYYADTNNCLLLSSCTHFDPTCADCVSGEVTCGNINPGNNTVLIKIIV